MYNLQNLKRIAMTRYQTGVTKDMKELIELEKISLNEENKKLSEQVIRLKSFLEMSSNLIDNILKENPDKQLLTGFMSHLYFDMADLYQKGIILDGDNDISKFLKGKSDHFN